MSTLKAQKVVAALPAVLEADTIYLMRVGTGYDQFVTNHSGTIVAYPMNQTAGGGVQLGGADASQTLIVSLNGGGAIQGNDLVAHGGSPASAGI